MRCLAVGLLLSLTGVPAIARDPFVITQVDRGLFRCRAPQLPCEFEQIRQAGIRTVLDIRAYQPLSSARERAFVTSLGMQYRHIRFSALRAPGLNTTETVFQATLCQEDYPLLIHCQHNRDRTSLVVGLYRVRVQGWAPQDAYDEMVRFRLRENLQHIHEFFWDNAYGPGQSAQRSRPE